MDMRQGSAKYFFDRHTDGLSLDLGDASECTGSESLASGVTLHVDHRGRPIILEIQGASKIIDITGLSSQQETSIEWDDIAERMRSTLDGERIWQHIVRRVFMPSFLPA
jgi:hypothetical protein